ncbi:DUF2306 domain-containing protein, partial [Marinobacter sp.]|uniref:DUF2306 domain-containing protein n=1 Tax=Marinobacter sp. TaxID=50741 RepID=UPI002B478663
FAIQMHITLALAAVMVGALQLILPKGTPMHRLAGRVWVLFLVVVALTSFFIHKLQVWGMWSPIHGLSIFTLIMLWVGVRAARAGNYRAHAITMSATYFFALVLTGALTLLPGRMMHEMVFG